MTDKVKKVAVEAGARIDRFLARFISKKLTVFVIGCFFLWLGKVEPENWVNIAMVYIGSQAAIDAVIALRNR